MIEFSKDSITIYIQGGGPELVTWTKDEWIEDPSIVLSIANAIKMYYTDYDRLVKICAPSEGLQ